MLSVKEVEKLIRAGKPGRHTDAEGLILKINETGAPSWIFRFTLEGRRSEMGLGPCRSVTLAEARAKRDAARDLVGKGLDPRIAPKVVTPTATPTFQQAAEAYIATHREGWKNAKHAQQWTNTLQTYAHPHIGDKLVTEISTADVVKILSPIWSTKHETATRVRNRIELVLDATKAEGHREGENPARLRGHLDKLLPKISKRKIVKHHAALPWEQAPAFMAKVRERSGIATKALEFAILCASRYGEVAHATWGEFDLEAATWTIPASRMKASPQGHRVPLSRQALALLNGLPGAHHAKDLVFPAPIAKGALSDSSLSAVIDRIHEADIEAGGKGYTDRQTGRIATQHGFRSTFRDWVLEATAFSEGLAELQLAHVVSNLAEAAYRRGDAVEKRRVLVQAWADFLATSEESLQPEAASAIGV